MSLFCQTCTKNLDVCQCLMTQILVNSNFSGYFGLKYLLDCLFELVCQSSRLEFAKAETKWQKLWSHQLPRQSDQRAEAYHRGRGGWREFRLRRRPAHRRRDGQSKAGSPQPPATTSADARAPIATRASSGRTSSPSASSATRHQSAAQRRLDAV